MAQQLTNDGDLLPPRFLKDEDISATGSVSGVVDSISVAQLKAKIVELQNSYASLNQLYLTTAALNQSLSSANKILSDANAVLRAENIALGSELLNLKKQNTSLENQLSEALLPYSNEKIMLQYLGQLLLQSETQLDQLRRLIVELNLSDNLALLLSSFDYWTVNSINNTLSTGFTSITNLISDQNDIENLKFSVIEQSLEGINVDNIAVFLISQSQKSEISKTSITAYGNVNLLELNPDDFTTKDTDYILYFTNKNFLEQNIPVRIYPFNNMFDLVVFKSLDSLVYNNNKLYLKQSGLAFYESMIYQQVNRGEHRILFVDKINKEGNFTCDINVYEIEEFYLPFKYTNTDIDELQQYLVGKMVYNKIDNTQTFYEVDEETILKILNLYFDPQNEQEIRIPE
jgi:hypothetical protein